jgi:hypothetical protein
MAEPCTDSLKRGLSTGPAGRWLAMQFSWVAATLVLTISTWNQLGLTELPTTRLQWITRATLILASVWTGTIIATLLFVLSWPLRRVGRGFRVAEAALLLFVGFLNAFIVPYIDFFSSHPAPIHLRYLVDWEFLGGTADVALNPLFIAVAATPFVAWMTFQLLLARRVETLRERPRKIGVATLLLLAILCQVAKVNLNTKKFGWELAPKVLRVTSVEHLLVESARLFTAERFSAREEIILRSLRGIRTGEGSLPEHQTLASLLQDSPRPAESAPGLALKQLVRDRLAAQKPVVFFVALLESFRPHESRLYAEGPAESQMPHFDQLAKDGVLFRNAFSTSNVTRSAQEAVVCGLQTGPQNSVMRDKVQNRPRCLSDRFFESFGKGGFTAFWHAGRYSFDSQGFFWTKHRFDRVMSYDDFPKNAPQTYWGKSDLALITRLFEEWPATRNTVSGPEFHLLLSVTNHHNFVLPSDAPPELKALANTGALPNNILTHRYTDEALGRLVAELHQQRRKNETLWEQTILVVLGDHGTLMPTSTHRNGFRSGQDNESEIAAARVNSHLALVVSGGLTSQALKAVRKLHEVDDTFRSQADLAVTIADLIGFEGFASVGDSLFARTRRWPVVVDLLDRIFMPERNLVFSADELEREVQSGEELGGHEKLYLRATRALLDDGMAGR